MRFESKSITMIMIGALCALGAAACATKVAPPPEPVVVSDMKEAPGQVSAQQSVTVSATVLSVDQKTRIVKLLAADGEEIVFRAGDEVRNLPQVKKGDVVQVTYYESIAIQVKKPGTATPGVTTTAGGGRAEPGEKPGAVAAESTRLVATVVKIDKKTSTITLKGPKGHTRTLPVKNRVHLDAVKVGDLVEVTFTEAIGISVAPPSTN